MADMAFADAKARQVERQDRKHHGEEASQERTGIGRLCET